MSRNETATGNNDLFMMLMGGASLALANHFMLIPGLFHQMMICAGFGLFCGLFLTSHAHVIEWCFCLLFGGLVVNLGIVGWPMIQVQALDKPLLLLTAIETMKWFGMLLGPFMITSYAGMVASRNFFNRYWSPKNIC